ncbi:MAG: antibiotic biosynthesis monooxygenase [Nitrospiraceae bacterium]|nr:antibiotic biosynthesis monooxygenase [Nitrospiraceae bacterium]
MERGNIRVVARVTARPDKVEELKHLLATLVEPTRQESGCLSYDLLQGTADDRDFTFVEQWIDQTAIDRHMQSAHVQEVLALVSELTAAQPDIRCYRCIEQEMPTARR